MAKEALESQADNGAFDLGAYLHVLWNRRLIVVAAIALVLGSAMAFTLQKTPLYESRTQVGINRARFSLDEADGLSEINVDAEKERVRSDAVTWLVKQELGTDASLDELRRSLTVEAIPNTEFLVIRYVHPDPKQAQRRSQIFAESYLEYKEMTLRRVSTALREPLEEEMARLNEELDEVYTSLALAEEPTEQITFQQRATELLGRIQGLHERLSEMIPPEALSAGEITVEASLPAKPFTPDYLKTGLLGLLTGAALGAVLAFVQERFDDRLRGRADLEAHLDAPVLAMIEDVRLWRKKRWRQQRALYLAAPGEEADGRAAYESYRTLRTGVLAAASRLPLETIVVTSAEEGSGKTTTAANLAVSLAQAGRSVIAVSADLRRPRLHQLFDVPNAVGLTNVLSGAVRLEDALVEPSSNLHLASNLAVLTSGPLPGNQAELLGSEAMGQLMRDLARRADFVVVDAAPILPVADALAMLAFCDGLIFVAEAERTTTSAIDNVRRQLDRMGVHVIGSVLNRSKTSDSQDYAPVTRPVPPSRKGHRTTPARVHPLRDDPIRRSM